MIKKSKSFEVVDILDSSLDSIENKPLFGTSLDDSIKKIDSQELFNLKFEVCKAIVNTCTCKKLKKFNFERDIKPVSINGSQVDQDGVLFLRALYEAINNNDVSNFLQGCINHGMEFPYISLLMNYYNQMDNISPSFAELCKNIELNKETIKG